MVPGGANIVRLRALGPLSRVADKETSEIEVETSIATGAAITKVIEDADLSMPTNIDAGQTTLARWWSDGERSIGAMRKIERTELGYIGESPLGEIVFEDRHHRLAAPHTASQATFSDAPGASLSYSKIEQLDPLRELFNYFTALVTLYTVGSLATLWTLAESGASSPPLASGEAKVFWARYPNPQSASNAVHTDAWTTPVASTDFTVNAQADGGGADLTGSVAVSVSKFSQAMKITLTNNHATDGFITLLKARGTPVTADDPTRVVEEDATSQTAYGKRTFPLDGPWIPTHAEAVALLLFLESIHKDPLRTLRLTFAAHRDTTHQDAAHQLDISDRITIVAANDTGLGINNDFFIESMVHRILPNGEHWVTYECSEATAYGGFWVLGVSTLGVETKLAF